MTTDTAKRDNAKIADDALQSVQWDATRLLLGGLDGAEHDAVRDHAREQFRVAREAIRELEADRDDIADALRQANHRIVFLTRCAHVGVDEMSERYARLYRAVERMAEAMLGYRKCRQTVGEIKREFGVDF